MEDNINLIIEKLEKLSNKALIRKPIILSFGDAKECKLMFEATFKQTDTTVSEFEMLPEYAEVIQWMTGNGGKGLLLMGDVGRGKTNIVAKVFPVVMFIKFGKIVQVYHSNEIPTKHKEIIKKSYKIPIVIDEFGVEPVTNDFGQKYEAFNYILDYAEMEMRLLILSTNLSLEEIQQRYGDRVLDRISRLCKIIQFKGKSKR